MIANIFTKLKGFILTNWINAFAISCWRKILLRKNFLVSSISDEITQDYSLKIIEIFIVNPEFK